MMNDKTRIVVIGASAGGHSAVKKILSKIDKNINAVFMVVQHITADASTFYGAILNKKTNLKVVYAQDGQKLETGTVYLSIPDHHLLVNKDSIKLSKGPTENLSRPAIDPLFRTAATSYGNRVIGIILTGLLNDGTSGLMAIHSCNGISIVQDPEEAEYKDMPLSALENAKPTYCSKLSSIAQKIEELVSEDIVPEMNIPAYIKKEAEISMGVDSNIPLENDIGSKVGLGCPNCGGPLWQMENHKHFPRYRCHTGHSFTQESLLKGQSGKVEESLWLALRTLEERKNILRKTLEHQEEREMSSLLNITQRRLQETQTSIDHLKQSMQIDPPKIDIEKEKSRKITSC